MLFGCRPVEEPALEGRILFWHDWGTEDTAVLDELLAGFSALNPDVRVLTVAVPPGTLRQRYEETAVLGLGPDLLVLSDTDVRPLADANLIRSIPDDVTNADKFLSTALGSLRYDDHLYGFPLSLRPLALYYNADKVAEPPGTLDALLQEARAGQSVALNAQFLHSLWGLPAFGGSLFDAEGRVVLNQGGYNSWLNWLKTAQETPGVILERNDEILRELFVSERVAYYVGSPQALPDLQEQMGVARVRSTVLPAGPNGPAGPLLQVEAILFNQASSNHQIELALALADFLTNAEQNARLMRDTNRVPANRRVRVDQQTFPVIAGFAAQARTAVPVPQGPQMETLVASGEDMLRGVLTGIVDVNEAADRLAQTVNQQYGFETLLAAPVVANCDAAGSLTVWHAWDGSLAAALMQVATEFMAQCEDAVVQLRQFAPEVLWERLQETNGNEPAPDLILGPSEWMLDLVNAGTITPLNGRVDADVLQRYVPVALNTLRADGQLYGLPVNLNLSALYYNGDVITDPATTLDDLLTVAAAGQKVALPLSFEDAFWGVGSFGGTLFDERYQLTLVESGFVSWLTWLQEAQNVPGIVLSVDETILQVLFSSGAVAYYAGPSHQLSALQDALGVEAVRITDLPAGPGGAAAPYLSADAFFITREVMQTNSDLALDFALYTTAVNAQTTLMTQAQMVPTNVNVDSTGYPAIAGFLMQAQTAVIWPQVPQVTALQQQGDDLYESVVLRQMPPAETACTFEIGVNQVNGFLIDETALPDICTSENGAITDD
ncbi:MAG: extracellular solute-binding protein [Chloroflexi bacterium]|nr:MAG: extracellular solute-binding protein [Chloroflexota bacterium]